MADRVNGDEVRKVWEAPELRRLQAGSAESGGGSIPDGGNPQTGSRS